MGFEGQVQFIASADPNAGDKVSVNSGNNQRGGVNQPLPLPLVVTVTDDGANVIKDSPIEFTVTQGGGNMQANPVDFKISTRVQGSYQKAGEASHTIDLAFDLVSCSISLSGATCNL